MVDRVTDLQARLDALLDCVASSEGPSRWIYLDEALNVHRRLRRAKASDAKASEPGAMREERSFRQPPES